MKRKVILIIGILSLFINSCDPMYFKEGKHSYFKFENKSNLDIAINNSFDNPNLTGVNKQIINANKESMIVYANSTNSLQLPP